jgi:pyruvate/2-oxoacid:ferredoxin oxidoreductase beta subunit
MSVTNTQIIDTLRAQALDMRSPTPSVEASMYQENHFKMLTKSQPEIAKQFLAQAQGEVNARWQMYQIWLSLKSYLPPPLLCCIKRFLRDN